MAGVTGAGYDFGPDTAWRQNGRRLLSVDVRGADRNMGDQTHEACAALLLITTKLLAPAAWRRPPTQPATSKVRNRTE